MSKNFCVHCGTVYLTQQQKDDLECAEIEREFISKNRFLKTMHSNELVVIEVTNFNVMHDVECFRGETKLEALRKAKEYLDGRGE